MTTRFEIKRATDGSFYFHLKAANAQIILASEGYTTKSNAEKGIASVKTNASQEERYERKMDSQGKPYFVLRASNGQVIGTSQMYSSNQEMENGIASVKTNAPAAAISDLTAAR